MCGTAGVSKSGPSGTDEGSPEGASKSAAKGPTERCTGARLGGRTGGRAVEPPIEALTVGPPFPPEEAAGPTTALTSPAPGRVAGSTKGCPTGGTVCSTSGRTGRPADVAVDDANPGPACLGPPWRKPLVASAAAVPAVAAASTALRAARQRSQRFGQTNFGS